MDGMYDVEESKHGTQSNIGMLVVESTMLRYAAQQTLHQQNASAAAQYHLVALDND